MQAGPRNLSLIACFLATACGDDSGSSSDGGTTDAAGGDARIYEAAENWGHDIRSIHLQLDLESRAGVASVVTSTGEPAVSLAIGDLNIEAVRTAGEAIPFEVVGEQLNIGIEAGEAAFQVSYSFAIHSDFDGWMPDSGVTFLWPTFCGNLYPCVTSPADGFEMTAAVTGAPGGSEAIYPAEIPVDAPSYMFGLAVGDFENGLLGTTADGTDVRVIYPLALETDSSAGTANLVDVVEWLETTLGPYPFGGEVASVAADWGGGDFGGMEHHPYWHVSSGSMYHQETHAHEAAHGWFGNGVRIQCWEDFVLSEGLATYLALRALGAAAVDISGDYECSLKSLCDGAANTVVLPDSTCNEIDILEHPLWSYAPYIKGAYFLLAVEDELGTATLDAALSEFFQDHVGESARMQDLIDHLKSKGSAETIDNLATQWLRTQACPIETASLCTG